MSKNKQLRKKTTETTQNNQNAFLARRGFAFVIDFIITNRLSLFVTGIVYGLMNNGNIQCTYCTRLLLCLCACQDYRRFNDDAEGNAG